MEIELSYILWATLFGAFRKISRTIKNGTYQQSFCVSGGKDGGGDGGGYSPPPPPDPKQTAAAQAAADRQTAQTNALLLNPNVKNPYGSISYDQNSYNIDGETITRPTQTITLSPAQQRQLDARNQISDSLNTAGTSLAARMPQTELLAPSTPTRPTSIDYSNVDATPTINAFEDDRQRVEKAVYDRQMRLMQPELEQQRKGLEERLVQTGNPLGSESYSKEMDRYQRGQNEAMQSLADRAVLAGADEQNRLFGISNQLKTQQIADSMRPYQTADQLRKDQIGEAQLLRNQQINELSAMLQGREAISLPIQAQYNQSALRAPDLAGMTQANYQSNLNAYNQAYQADQANSAAASSGMWGIGAALARPAASWLFG